MTRLIDGVRRGVATASAVLLLAGLSGCAASAPEADPRTPLAVPTSAAAMSADQKDAMADAQVSADEYEASFGRFESCLSAEGYAIVLGERVNSVIQYSVPSDAVDSGADARCYDKEFSFVDAAWQIAHEDTSASAESLRDCLTSLGVAPAATVKEMTAQFDENGLSIAQCPQ